MSSLKRNFKKTLSVLIPLSSDNLTPMLSPILGQHGIVISEFISQFQTKTRFLSRELVVCATVGLYSNNTYTLSVEFVNYNLLYKSMFFSCDPDSVFDFYKAVFLYTVLTANFNYRFLKINYFNFLGYVHSHN